MPLDPLIAFGLAANILQFIDFTSRLVSKGHAIHRSAEGCLPENAQIGIVSNRLRSLASGLQQAIRSNGTTYHQSDEEKAIETICQDCIEVAEDLLRRLEPLKVKGNMTRFKSYRQAFKSVWNKEAIDMTYKRMELFRGELNTFLLQSIREKMDTNAKHQGSILDFISQSSTAGQNAQSETQRILHHQHHEDQLLSAQMQGLTTGTIIEEHQKTRREITNAVFQMAQWGLSTRYPQGFSVSYHTAKLAAQKLAPGVLLESLSFSAMGDRFEGVPEAYRSTFEWIFNPTGHAYDGWSNFVQWLHNGGGLYWISGKAGSGKSTLLKFIINDSRTRQHLSTWAGGDRLVFSHFFFWKGGNTLQKSHTGLLRSLLYDALSQRKELISIVLAEKLKETEDTLTDYLYEKQPEVSNDYDSISVPGRLRSDLDRWSHTELITAFQTLVGSKTQGTKFCFIVDGLDEFDGDHAETVELFRNIPSSSKVKLCISSRPLNAYERAFTKLPGLRVQELTKNDIRLFVQEKVGKNQDMLQLIQRQPYRGGQLTQKIVEKASGVFLWVTLVVKSLLNGLVNNDTILDLETRLDLLPADLEELYWHMLRNIDPVYKVRSSRFFQIVCCAREPPHALALSLADEEDPDISITAEIRPMPKEEQEERLQQIENRVRSVCAGLLEIQGLRVQFLHRTVLDFFGLEDVKKMLHGVTAGTAFHPDIAILSACLLQLKWLLPRPQKGDQCNQLWNLIQDGLSSASRADADGVNLGLDLMEEFDKLASYHWSTGFDLHSAVHSHINTHWTNWIPFEYNDCDRGLHHTFISYAVRYQLTSYLRNKLLRSPWGLKTGSERPLLDVAIPPVQFVGFQGMPAPQSPSPQTIALLLQSGEHPNQSYVGRSPWKNALSHVCEFRPNPFHHEPKDILAFGRKWSQILTVLLQYRADINAEVSLGEGTETLTRSALAVVRDVLSQWDSTGAEELQAILVENGALYRSTGAGGSSLKVPAYVPLKFPQRKSAVQSPPTLRRITPEPGIRQSLYLAARRL